LNVNDNFTDENRLEVGSMGMLVLLGISVQAYYGGMLLASQSSVEIALSIFVIAIVSACVFLFVEIL
jgi:hypothetical protein